MVDIEHVPGNSSGSHLAPVRKLLLHTTEGTTVEGALAAYEANNSWPHDTVDCRVGRKPRMCTHLDYSVAARSLRNPAGGVETNRAGVIQVELVGFAERPSDIDWAWLGQNYVGPVCRNLGIPVQSTVRWIAYPASYGLAAPQRLPGAAWTAYEGILGHQHCPENSHGDPGFVPINVVLAAAAPTPTPKDLRSDMISICTHPDGRRVDLVGIAPGGRIWHWWAPDPDSEWSPGEVLDPGLGETVTCTWADDALVVTVVSSDGRPYKSRWREDEGWSTWTWSPANAWLLDPSPG